MLRKALKASVPCDRGSTFMWGGAIFSVKYGPVPGFSGGSEYSVTPGQSFSASLYFRFMGKDSCTSLCAIYGCSWDTQQEN